MRALLIGWFDVEEIINKFNLDKMNTYIISDFARRMIYKRNKTPNVYYVNNVNDVNEYTIILKELNMKFDKVIMNPPYKGNLHVSILQEVCKFADSVVSLEPNDFLVDCLYKDKNDISDSLRGHIKNVEFIGKNDMMKSFPGTTFSKDACIVSINMRDNNLKSIADYKDKIQQKIINKIVNFDNLGSHYELKVEKYFVKIPYIHGHQGKRDMYEVVSPKCKVNDESTSGYHVYFKTRTEADNLLKSFKLVSYRYIYKCFKKSINNDPDHLIWLGDYTKEWTDKDIYALFDISKREQKIIEETMKEYM